MSIPGSIISKKKVFFLLKYTEHGLQVPRTVQLTLPYIGIKLFPFAVSENSPILLERSFYTMYTAGENSPMAHDYCIEKLSWCTQWVKILP